MPVGGPGKEQVCQNSISANCSDLDVKLIECVCIAALGVSKGQGLWAIVCDLHSSRERNRRLIYDGNILGADNLRERRAEGREYYEGEQHETRKGELKAAHRLTVDDRSGYTTVSEKIDGAILRLTRAAETARIEINHPHVGAVDCLFCRRVRVRSRIRGGISELDCHCRKVPKQIEQLWIRITAGNNARSGWR